MRQAADAVPAGGLTVVGSEVTEPRRLALAGGEAVLFTQRCPGAGRPNEDACALLPWNDDSGVLVVADGVGGHPAGGDAAALAVDSMRRAVQAGRLAGEVLRDAVLSGIETANRRVLADGRGALTTIAVANVRAGRVRPVHVGDSGVLVTGQRGRLKLLTPFHSPVGYAVEAGLMDEKEAVHHEERHVVSNVVGAADMRMEIGSPVTLAPRDTVLVASDGLFDNFFPDEIVERVRKGALEDVAARLGDEATKRMRRGREGRPSKPDDLTFMLFRLTRA